MVGPFLILAGLDDYSPGEKDLPRVESGVKELLIIQI